MDKYSKLIITIDNRMTEINSAIFTIEECILQLYNEIIKLNSNVNINLKQEIETLRKQTDILRKQTILIF